MVDRQRRAMRALPARGANSSPSWTADDEWSPEKLALQVQYFQEHPDTGLLHAAVDGTRDGAIPGPPRHLHPLR
jgi:hypothetical protein